MGQVIDVDQLASLGEKLRAENRRVVLTNGHFDLLHVGHLRYLKSARTSGDVLIVGVNDDAVTLARKGPRRPILPDRERVELVAGLESVDFAFIFHEETADTIIERLRPDVYAKGGDYSLDASDTGAPLPEAGTARALGCEIRIIPLTPDQSTSAIEHRIIGRWREHRHDPR